MLRFLITDGTKISPETFMAEPSLSPPPSPKIKIKLYSNSLIGFGAVTRGREICHSVCAYAVSWCVYFVRAARWIALNCKTHFIPRRSLNLKH